MAGLWLALYVAVWGAAPLADARLEAASHGDVVHVEADRGTACEPGHDHATCQICHFGAGRALPAGSVQAQATRALPRAGALVSDLLRPGSAAATAVLPRAPPA